jgi:hypothetical protein
MNIKKIFSFLNFGNLLVLFSKKEILKAEQDTASINHPVGDTTKALLFGHDHGYR